MDSANSTEPIRLLYVAIRSHKKSELITINQHFRKHIHNSGLQTPYFSYTGPQVSLCLKQAVSATVSLRHPSQ